MLSQRTLQTGFQGEFSGTAMHACTHTLTHNACILASPQKQLIHAAKAALCLSRKKINAK